MSGVHLTTISPSRTSSSRSTPCVEGCCGPIEIVICVSSGRSTISNCGGMFTVVLISQDCHRDTEAQRNFKQKSQGAGTSKVSLCVSFSLSLSLSLCLCASVANYFKLYG